MDYQATEAKWIAALLNPRSQALVSGRLVPGKVHVNCDLKVAEIIQLAPDCKMKKFFGKGHGYVLILQSSQTREIRHGCCGCDQNAMPCALNDDQSTGGEDYGAFDMRCAYNVIAAAQKTLATESSYRVLLVVNLGISTRLVIRGMQQNFEYPSFSRVSFALQLPTTAVKRDTSAS
ncbi:hypothetical protein CHU98_g2210 [Xylaria longipes]|nr:hypothetical protein CHU98_g2210 [Xylaria longipes]